MSGVKVADWYMTKRDEMIRDDEKDFLRSEAKGRKQMAEWLIKLLKKKKG